MGTFSLTEAAKADLKSIATYTQRRWGKEQRRIYARQFDDAFHMLADTLEAGIACDVIKVGWVSKIPHRQLCNFLPRARRY